MKRTTLSAVQSWALRAGIAFAADPTPGCARVGLARLPGNALGPCVWNQSRDRVLLGPCTSERELVKEAARS